MKERTVMANFETDKRMRLCVDQEPTGVATTMAQEHIILGFIEKGLRPVFYMSRAMTSRKSTIQR